MKGAEELRRVAAFDPCGPPDRLLHHTRAAAVRSSYASARASLRRLGTRDPLASASVLACGPLSFRESQDFGCHVDSDGPKKASQPPWLDGEYSRRSVNRPRKNGRRDLVSSAHAVPLVVVVQVASDKSVVEEPPIQALGASRTEERSPQENRCRQQDRHDGANDPDAHQTVPPAIRRLRLGCGTGISCGWQERIRGRPLLGRPGSS